MDSNDTATAAFVVMAGAYHQLLLLKRRKRSRWWIRSFLAKRAVDGAYNSLMRDLRLQSGFENFVRMTASDFEELLNLVAPIIAKNENGRNPVSPGEMLAATLRYLATGDSYSSIMYLHRISKSAVSRFVPIVCKAIVNALRNQMKVPASEEEWMSVAKGFATKWNYPNCVGALDGKHITLQAPANSGSLFYNYKGSFSIVLMAVCDADYNLLYVDVGVQGRIADGGVLLSTDFCTALESKKLKFPPKQTLPGRDVKLLFVIAADDAFAMSEHIMKPYTGRHKKGSVERAFNYRHSRARRVIENVFGIMSSVFRVLRKPILLKPENAAFVTLACAYLHNFLRRKCSTSINVYSPVGVFDSEDDHGSIIDGTWRHDDFQLPGLRWCSQSHENPGVYIREEMADFFQSQPLPWQNRYA